MNELNKKIIKYKLGSLGSHVWLACCMKHDFGGTKEAVKMYDKIMNYIIKLHED